MSVHADAAGGIPRSSDWYASRARRRSLIAASIAIVVAGAYAGAIVATEGDGRLVLPLVAILVVFAVLANPAVGVYMLFGAGLLFEQFTITGLAPITSQTHIFENLSEYTDIPLRMSLTDLLIVLTALSWAARLVTAKHQTARMGPFGWAVAVYLMVFGVGVAIGASRGGAWDPNATLGELRGPTYLFVVYFLAANLIRHRAQLAVLAWVLVAAVGVKAVQGLLNYQEALSGPLAVAATIANQAVTADEDVIFFDLAIALTVVLMLLGIRGRLTYTLLALQPLILAAEILTQRRAGFIALGAVLMAVTLLVLFSDTRRGIALIAIGTVCFGIYLALFWDQSGPLGGPIRAIRVVFDHSSVSTRDQSSDAWREIENRNIAYTISQLPLTGVGVGQQYIFREEPPALPASFTYWRYITHNALLWMWLKVGPLGAFALWFLVARVLLVASAAYVRLRDPALRAAAAAIVCLTVIQIVFSSVDLGLTYSRTMLVLAVTLGLGALIVQRGAPGMPLRLSTEREAR
jgi:hypothetical protein